MKLITLAATLLPTLASADIIIQSTTSTQNSGLYDVLLPQIKEATGITANVVAVGTGQAIKNAENCDGDLLLVHAKSAEEAFVEAGFGTTRHDLMYNDFVILGPADDPAAISLSEDLGEVFTRLATGDALFASRGDDSGTHKKEVSLWQNAGIDPQTGSGDWYRETGSGMGATLNAAVGMGAYTMSDRATWISFENKGDFVIVFEGSDALFNQYGVIPVSPDHCPSVNHGEAREVMDWLLGEEGQAAIGAYVVNEQHLFFPNANP